MKHRTLHQRLMTAAVSTAVLIGLVVALSISQVQTVTSSLSRVNDVNSVKQRYAINFRGSVHDRAISLRDVTLEKEPQHVKRHLVEIDRLASNYADSATRLDALFAEKPATVSDRERELLGEIKSVEARTLPLMRKVIELRQSGDQAGAQQVLMTQAAAPFVDWLAAINRLIDHEEVLNKSESAKVDIVVGRFAWLMTLSFLVITAGIVGTLWLLGRGVRRALLRAIDASERIADGDLAHHLDTRGLGETQQLLDALSRMRAALAKTVSAVRDNADQVARTSTLLAQDNLDLASRTEHQTSALQRAAEAMEELGSTVSHNAENAREANLLAEGAAEVARQGGDVVGQVVETMQKIDESSGRIADIIGTIDGIAFQTNILALNAAVEAARAGEQGRGFAVVASEVRNLAQRSADAAREIKQLIANSVERVQMGSQLVNRAGATMTEIVSASRRVSDIVAEITMATAEQSRGIEQVGRAVTEMEATTRQNAALVEQGAAGAQGLREQSAKLVAAVSAFRLGQP